MRRSEAGERERTKRGKRKRVKEDGEWRARPREGLTRSRKSEKEILHSSGRHNQDFVFFIVIYFFTFFPWLVKKLKIICLADKRVHD